MRATTRITVLTWIVVMGLLPQATHAAGTPAQTCAAAKLKAAGKKLAGGMKCYALAKTKSAPVDPACLTKADWKFALGMTKAGSMCAGTTVTLGASVDACVTALLPAVPGDGRCPSKSTNAAGKAGGGTFLCRSKGITKPGDPFLACNGKIQLKIGRSMAAAGGCTDGAPILATLAGCVAAVADVVDPPPAVTTTTTSTSTTSTTTPGALGTCGNPITLPPEGGTVTGTTSGTGGQAGSCGTSSASGERVYRWVPAVSGTALIETCGVGTLYDSVLYVRAGTCAAGAEVACNDDACGFASRLTPTVTAGVPYFIVVDGFSGLVGPFSLRVLPPGAATCGDGFVDEGEACDGGVCRGDRACLGNCTCDVPATCGNGQVDDLEECDNAGTACGDHGTCRTDCTCGECGDGVLDPADECEPWLDGCAEGNGCTAGCECRAVIGLRPDAGSPEDAAASFLTSYALTNIEVLATSRVIIAELPLGARALLVADSRVANVIAAETPPPLREHSGLLAMDGQGAGGAMSCDPLTRQCTSTGVQRVGASWDGATQTLGTLSNGDRHDGRGVGVAIMDSGIDVTHPDLHTAVVGGVDARRKQWMTDLSWRRDSRVGHGTKVAGMVAATGHLSLEGDPRGVVGIAPGAALYSVRFGIGGELGDKGTEVRALDWIKDHRVPPFGGTEPGIQVVNASFGDSLGKCSNSGLFCAQDSHCGICAGTGEGCFLDCGGTCPPSTCTAGANRGRLCGTHKDCPAGLCQAFCASGLDKGIVCRSPSTECATECVSPGTCTKPPSPPPPCAAILAGAPTGECLGGGVNSGRSCRRDADCPSGHCFSRGTDELWCGLLAAGITVVAAAGNETVDMSDYSIAAWDTVIATAGLTDSDGYAGGYGPLAICNGSDDGVDDQFSPFSNYGAPVDIVAPAACLLTTHTLSSAVEDGISYTTVSGTSLAAPLVAGAAALAIQRMRLELGREPTPAEVKSRLQAEATERGTVPGNPTPNPDVGVGVLHVCGYTQSDPTNCGGCGRSCIGFEQCIDGQCVAPAECPPPFERFELYCESCITTSECVQFSCSPISPQGHILGLGELYEDHYPSCDAFGRSGGPCTAEDGSTFDNSYTFSTFFYGDDPGCTTPITVCGSCACGRMACPLSSSGPTHCVDPKSDVTNCGRCGNVCWPSEVCDEGLCTPP